MIGNKTDEADRREVTEERGRELADELGMQFMETSAKVDEGVTEAFYALARCVAAALDVSLSDMRYTGI